MECFDEFRSFRVRSTRPLSKDCQLFAALDAQTVSAEGIIFINDHSSDATPELLESYCNSHGNARWFTANGNGKKGGLREAVALTNSTYLLFTDADCTPCPTWVEQMVTFGSEEHPDILLAPMVITPTHSFLLKFQALDFASLVAAGAGATLLGMPMYGNGANMMVRREVWIEAQQEIREDIASGDDVFLIHAVKRRKGKIEYIKSKDTIVSTKGVPTWRTLLNQRQRWGGKSSAYRDWFTIIVAIVVLLMNLLITICMCTYFLAPMAAAMFWLMWLSKLVIDSALVLPFLINNGMKHLIWYWPLVALLYPIYLLACGFSAIFGKSSWKR